MTVQFIINVYFSNSAFFFIANIKQQFVFGAVHMNVDLLLVATYYTVLSRKYAPPNDNPHSPPIVLMKTTAQVLSVKILTVTNNLCDVYKTL